MTDFPVCRQGVTGRAFRHFENGVLLKQTDARFQGFSEKGLRFLSALARHNNRSWFSARKSVYERELREPMEMLVIDLANALRRAKIPITGDVKKSLFRIYRDVRFSADKNPYKTHLAAYLSYDGLRKTPGGLYIRIAPGSSFLSIAFYDMPRPMLQRWRAEIAARPARFRKILTRLEKKNLRLVSPDEAEDALSRMPRGFEKYAQSECSAYLRLTSFLVHEDLEDTAVGNASLVDHAVSLTKNARPLLDFGWSLE